MNGPASTRTAIAVKDQQHSSQLAASQSNALLATALTDQQDFSYGTDEGHGPAYGAELRTVPWQPPATITAGMVEAATCRLAKLAHKMEPVSAEKAGQWLYELAMMTAHSRDATAEDLEAKVKLMTRLVSDMPSAIFTRGSAGNPDSSLRRALTRFKPYFPSGGELIEFLEEEKARLNTQVFRLEQIVKTGERQGPPKWSKDLAEAHGRKLAEERRKELAALAIIAEALPPATAVNMGPSPRAVRASNSLGEAVKAVSADLETKRLVKEGEVA